MLLIVAAILIAVGLWSISRRGNIPRAPSARPGVAIQDGKTIDFSSGKAVVKDSAKEKAALDRSVAEMNAAAANVTFAPQPSATTSASSSSSGAAVNTKK